MHRYNGHNCVPAVLAMRTEGEQQDGASLYSFAYEACFHSKCAKAEMVRPSQCTLLAGPEAGGHSRCAGDERDQSHQSGHGGLPGGGGCGRGL